MNPCAGRNAAPTAAGNALGHCDAFAVRNYAAGAGNSETGVLRLGIKVQLGLL